MLFKNQIGLTNLEIHPSPLPEDLPKQTLSPFEYVAQTSERKALAVYSSLLNNPTGNTAAPTNGNNDASGGTYQRLKPPPDPSLVISADTIILHPPTGTILEKPTSESHHISMLNTLLSPAQNPTRSHKVYTAITVLAPLTSARDPGYAVQTHVEETTVRFAKDVTEEVVKAYVRTREGADKAGGYAIQGLGGALLVDGIDGSWDNVVGLPVRKTLGLVEKVLNEADDEGGGGAFEDDDDDNDEGEGEGDSGDEEGDDRKNA